MLSQEEINVAHVAFAVSITANRTEAPGNLDNVPICMGLLCFPHASSTLLEPPASWGPMDVLLMWFAMAELPRRQLA